MNTETAEINGVEQRSSVHIKRCRYSLLLEEHSCLCVAYANDTLAQVASTMVHPVMLVCSFTSKAVHSEGQNNIQHGRLAGQLLCITSTCAGAVCEVH